MAAATQPTLATQTAHSMTVRGLKPFYGKRLAVQALDLDVRPNQIMALIGPSGCGKSTLLRAINRMHDKTPGARGGVAHH